MKSCVNRACHGDVHAQLEQNSRELNLLNLNAIVVFQVDTRASKWVSLWVPDIVFVAFFP